MHKGYAFVQFTNPFDARNACHGEDGRNILSQILGKSSSFVFTPTHTNIHILLSRDVVGVCLVVAMELRAEPS